MGIEQLYSLLMFLNCTLKLWYVIFTTLFQLHMMRNISRNSVWHQCTVKNNIFIMFLTWYGLFLLIISLEVTPSGPPVPHELQKRHWTYIQADIKAIAIIKGKKKKDKNCDFRLIFDLLISRGLVQRKELSDFSTISAQWSTDQTSSFGWRLLTSEIIFISWYALETIYGNTYWP